MPYLVIAQPFGSSTTDSINGPYQLWCRVQAIILSLGERVCRRSHCEQVSKIKRGTKISFPAPIFLLLSPTFFLPLPFSSPLFFLLGWQFHCVTIPGLEVSNFGSFHLSIPQACLVSLQHSWHWLLWPLSFWSQPCPWFPAATNHHLVAVAGGGEAVVGGGWRTPQTELM